MFDKPTTGKNEQDLRGFYRIVIFSQRSYMLKSILRKKRD